MMPMGKGTYGDKVGRPKKKKKTLLSSKQKTLPSSLKRKIVKAKSGSSY